METTQTTETTVTATKRHRAGCYQLTLSTGDTVWVTKYGTTSGDDDADRFGTWEWDGPHFGGEGFATKKAATDAACAAC